MTEATYSTHRAHVSEIERLEIAVDVWRQKWHHAHDMNALMRATLEQIRAIAQAEQGSPIGLHQTAFAMIEKEATKALER